MNKIESKKKILEMAKMEGMSYEQMEDLIYCQFEWLRKNWRE